jgi:hypothetical protein
MPRYRRCWGLLVIAAVLLGGAAAAHDVYIGYGQAEVAEDRFSGKLAYTKLDLLQAMEKLHGEPLYTLSPSEFESLTLSYLSAHFQVASGPDTLQLEIVGRSQKGDSVILDFSFQVDRPLEAVRVRNDVLFELFPQQVNTLTVSTASGQARYLFHPDKRVIEMEF